VNECVVLAKAVRGGQVKLAAFVVYDPAHHVTVSELRRYLKKALPEHLVPSAFVGLDALPRDGDGAVDRGALPDPFGGEDEYVAPRTEMERVLAETWCEVLGLDKVSVHDNFFDVGGHSLLAVRVVTKLDKKVGVRLNQAVMVLQTLEQIAAECERRAGTGPAAPAAASSTAPAAASSGADGDAGTPPVAAPEGGIARKLFGSFLKSSK
jgi:acyl carrier protein